LIKTTFQFFMYNLFLRRSSQFVLGIFTAAFVFELGFDSAMDGIFDRLNKDRQWKDLKNKLTTPYLLFRICCLTEYSVFD
jgi:ubiquinol-cytochrome c reductase subunit 9